MSDFLQSAVRILEPQRRNDMSDFLQSAVRILEPQRQNGMPDFSQSAVRILEPQRQNGMPDFSQSAGCPMPKLSEIGGPVLEIWQGVGEEEGYMQDIQEWAVNTKEKAGGGDDLAGELSGTSASGLLGELTPFLFGSLDVVPTRRR
ncbi:hypothetical protein BJ912DRAFT_932386 [Pholiota molesta]|nr:hypothetical protein BJ912DRAFT_932386 [Pholiota molesta]